MRKNKKMWLPGILAFLPLAGCALAEGTSSTTQPVLGDHSITDQDTHYNYGGLTGNSTELALVIPGVKANQLATLESDFNAMRTAFGLATCTTAGGCFRVVDDQGNALTLNTDDSKRQEATWGLAHLGAESPNARLTLIVPRDATSAKAKLAVQWAVSQAAIKGAAFAYVIPSGTADQAAITTALAGRTSFVIAAPAGALDSTLVVRVGGTTYTGGGADSVWIGSPGAGDVMSLMQNIPGTFNGSAVPAFSSVAAGVAMIVGRLDNQSSGTIATRAILNAASGTHFNTVVGGSKVFKDGSSL